MLPLPHQVKKHKQYPHLYLNEHCNIAILGEDLQEYIFDTNESQFTNSITKPSCPLLKYLLFRCQ